MRVLRPISDRLAIPEKEIQRTHIPTQLLGKTSSRLYWLAIMVLVSTIILAITRHFLDSSFRAIEKQPLILSDVALLLLSSLAVILIHRIGFLPPVRSLEMGVTYEVVVGFGLATLEFGHSQFPGHWPIGISAVPMWILAFGIFVPSTPSRTLIAGFVSACTSALSYQACRCMLKIPAWDRNELALWLAPSFLMAGWAYFLSADLYRMEVAVHKAREMGSYALEKLLGKGGMGEVWSARHRRLHSGAAVKLIRPEVLAQKTGREAHALRHRFEREAQATARLRSPHTVTLHDFGVAEDGSFYYAMELLEGLDLEELVQRFGPQSPARTTKILQQVCESLAEAHTLGLVHRDIKPSNVFLARLGMTCDFAKVLDFGLVKAESAGTTLLTVNGTAAGTPAYMAPELASGAFLDGRADLYSLGCVGYFLLSGEPVFDEPTPIAVALAHAQKPPVPLSQRTELSVPPELEEIIMRCLAKRPEDRPRDASELAHVLAAVVSADAWTQEQADRWWRVNLPKFFAAGDLRPAEALSQTR